MHELLVRRGAGEQIFIRFFLMVPLLYDELEETAGEAGSGRRNFVLRGGANSEKRHRDQAFPRGRSQDESIAERSLKAILYRRRTDKNKRARKAKRSPPASRAPDADMRSCFRT